MYLNKAIRLVGMAGLIVGTIWATEAYADARIRMFFQTDGIEIEGMGQILPATQDTNTIWLSGNNARLNSGDTISTIILGDSGRVLRLDHVKKQYSEIDMGKPYDSAGSELQKLMATMSISVEVTSTEEELKIGDWNCRKYIIEKQIGQMTTTTEVWATTDVEINTESFHRLLNGLMVYMPDYENAMKQLAKIEGMVVREMTTAEVMGQWMNSSSELIDVHKEDAPKDAFTVPEGYKKVPMPIPGMH